VVQLSDQPSFLSLLVVVPVDQVVVMAQAFWENILV
jgi:hypothetical protein